jgi:hypothetical protein
MTNPAELFTFTQKKVKTIKKGAYLMWRDPDSIWFVNPDQVLNQDHNPNSESGRQKSLKG